MKKIQKLFLDLLLVNAITMGIVSAHKSCDMLREKHERAQAILKNIQGDWGKSGFPGLMGFSLGIRLIEAQLVAESLHEMLKGCELELSEDTERLVFDPNTTLNQRRILTMRANVDAFRKRRNKNIELPEGREKISDDAHKAIDSLEKNYIEEDKKELLK